MNRRWLHVSLFTWHGGEEPGVEAELHRVAAVLDADPVWRDWWSGDGRAELDVLIVVARPGRSDWALAGARYAGFDEGVRRRRGRVEVSRWTDSTTMEGLDPEERRQRVLPELLEALAQVRSPLPDVPVEALPPPLSAAVLRRRRLHELRSGADDARS